VARLGRALLITRYIARSARSWLAQRATEGTMQARSAKLDVLNMEYLSRFSYTPRTICIGPLSACSSQVIVFYRPQAHEDVKVWDACT